MTDSNIPREDNIIFATPDVVGNYEERAMGGEG
jgi:hypothetical protein